jgi:hypothetical protein
MGVITVSGLSVSGKIEVLADGDLRVTGAQGVFTFRAVAAKTVQLEGGK